MKCVIIFAAVLAVSSAQFGPYRPQKKFPSPVAPPAPRPAARVSSNDAQANTVRLDSDISPDGAFSYAFETDNGISAQAQGTPRDFGGNPPVVPVVIQGSYSYTGADGVPVSISYIADENGYQAQGDAIPTAPPVPEAIARSLELIARNAPRQ